MRERENIGMGDIEFLDDLDFFDRLLRTTPPRLAPCDIRPSVVMSVVSSSILGSSAISRYMKHLYVIHLDTFLATLPLLNVLNSMFDRLDNIMQTYMARSDFSSSHKNEWVSFSTLVTEEAQKRFPITVEQIIRLFKDSCNRYLSCSPEEEHFATLVLSKCLRLLRSYATHFDSHVCTYIPSITSRSDQLSLTYPFLHVTTDHVGQWQFLRDFHRVGKCQKTA